MIPRRVFVVLLLVAVGFHTIMHVRAGCGGWDLLTCDQHETRWGTR